MRESVGLFLRISGHQKVHEGVCRTIFGQHAKFPRDSCHFCRVLLPFADVSATYGTLCQVNIVIFLPKQKFNSAFLPEIIGHRRILLPNNECLGVLSYISSLSVPLYSYAI
jgi:hypothetical protein